MKRALAATALAAFCLAPVTAAACDEYDDSMASATPPAQVASVAPSAVSKAPAVSVAKAPASKLTKQVAVKRSAPASDTKVVAGTSN